MDNVSRIEVQVITTSGTAPENGFDHVPAHQPVKVELARAQKQLEITQTEGWVALVADREIDTSKSYADNGLAGEIKIDWGPREGGGGQTGRRDA